MAGETIESTFRDFTTLNVPSSGKHEPRKSEIRNLLNAFLGQQTGANAGALIRTSKSALDGLSPAAFTMGWVLGDANPDLDGVYEYDSGTWVKRGPLPYSVIHLNNADAGTPNAIQVTTAFGIPSAAFGALYILNVTQDNTGAVTVSINGAAAKPLISNTGAPLLAGAITAGMAPLCVDDGANIRLLVPGDIDAIIAAAEALLAAAEALAGSAYNFNSKGDLEGADVPGTVQAVRVAGFGASNDGGGALYAPALDNLEPVHGLKAQDANGRWYEIAEARVTSKQAGILPSNSAELNSARMEGLLAYCEEVIDEISTSCVVKRAQLMIEAGIHNIDPIETSPTEGGLTIVGRGMGHSVLRCPEGTALKMGDYGDRYGAGPLPNFSHMWVQDLTLLGDIDDIVPGSLGFYAARAIRDCGLLRVQILGFDTGFNPDDCWTFSAIDLHVHKCGTRLVEWLTPNVGTMRGGRYDGGGCEENAILLKGLGQANDARSFFAYAVTVQESLKGCWELVDVGDAKIHTYLENYNQSNGGHPGILCRGSTGTERAAQALRDNVPEGSARKMGQLRAEVYCSPGASTWTGTEVVIQTTNECMGYVDALVKTGSSAINRALQTDAKLGRLAGTMNNMSADPLLLTGTDQMFEVDWIRHNTAGDIVERRKGVQRDGHYKPAFRLSPVRLSGTTGTSTGANPGVFTFQLAGQGSPTEFTFSTADKVQGAGPYLIRKTSSTGTLRLISTGSTGFVLASGAGSTYCQLASAVGACTVEYDATNDVWVVTPQEGNWTVGP